jgi:hypothetical protein
VTGRTAPPCGRRGQATWPEDEELGDPDEGDAPLSLLVLEDLSPLELLLAGLSELLSGDFAASPDSLDFLAEPARLSVL